MSDTSREVATPDGGAPHGAGAHAPQTPAAEPTSGRPDFTTDAPERMATAPDRRDADTALERTQTMPAVAPAATPGVRSSGAGTAAVAPAPAPAVNRPRPARVRKARLRLSRIDPWSVMKTAFLFSIAAGITLWVATYLVWGVLGSSGLFESINKFVSDLVDNPNDPTKFQLEQYVSTRKVLGLTALIAGIDVVILTALATLGSFLYNLSATMLGGIEVTLAED